MTWTFPKKSFVNSFLLSLEKQKFHSLVAKNTHIYNSLARD